MEAYCKLFAVSREGKHKVTINTATFHNTALMLRSLNVEAFVRCDISSNFGCRHVPGGPPEAIVGAAGTVFGVEGADIDTKP